MTVGSRKLLRDEEKVKKTKGKKGVESTLTHYMDHATESMNSAVK